MSEQKPPTLEEIRWAQQERMYISLVQESGITLENGDRYLIQGSVKYLVSPEGTLTQMKATPMEEAVWEAVSPLRGLMTGERLNMLRGRDDMYGLVGEIIAFNIEGEMGGYITNLANALTEESVKLREKIMSAPKSQETILRNTYAAIKGIAQMRGIKLEE